MGRAGLLMLCGMTEAELGDRGTLRRREVEVIADALKARIIGRGEVTRQECLETFGVPARNPARTILPSREPARTAWRQAFDFG